jgi:hypothetical protein
MDFRPFRRLAVAAAAALALAAPLPGVAGDEAAQAGDLTITRAWVRASIGTSHPAAAYFTVENRGAAADRLIRVTSPAAGMSEIHVVEEEGGVMRMRPAAALEIPPGGRLELTAGGTHVMLMQLREPLAEGGTLTLELTFERAGTAAVAAPILGLGARGPE